MDVSLNFLPPENLTFGEVFWQKRPVVEEKAFWFWRFCHSAALREPWFEVPLTAVFIFYSSSHFLPFSTAELRVIEVMESLFIQEPKKTIII